MSQYNFNFDYSEQASLVNVNGFPGNSMVDTDVWFNEPYATSSTTSWDEEQRPLFVEQTDASFTLSTSGSASPNGSLSMTPFLDPQLLNAVASSSSKPARANHRFTPYPASNPARPRHTSLSPPSHQVQNDGFFAAGQAQPGPLNGAYSFPGQPSLPPQHCEAPSATYPPMEYWTASSTAGMAQQWDARTEYVLGWADSLPNNYAQHTTGPECIPDGFQYIPDVSATGFTIPLSYPYDATPGPSQPYHPYLQQPPSLGPPPPAHNIHATDPGPSRRRRNHSSGMRLIPGGMPQPSAYPISSLPAPPLTHAHAQYPTASPPSDLTPPEPRHPQPTRSRKRRAPAEDEEEKPKAKRRKSGPSHAEQSSATSQVGCTPAGVQSPSTITFDTEEPEDDLQSLAAPNHVTHGAAGPPEASTGFTPQRTPEGRYLCLVPGCRKTCTTLDDVKRHVGTVQAHASFRELDGWDAFKLKYEIKERHLNGSCPICGVVKRRDTSGRHEESKIHLRNLKRAADRKGQSNGECLLTNGPKASSSKAPVGVDLGKRTRKSENSTSKAPPSTKGRTRTHQL
ncbi:hypothetical protein HETIRDRAFT_164961 [Heterobasidion irregulare TC 32-1]|uniref:Uncharacterized protein n=1 Tax=Heterobasidion irregulare (strain TC 32-1) TaxID=747525 RepID=W4JMS0_HETIT|nr:uncharacterized protein HETIRDRAFT_164961 [Heterobasidion irregulare TC 32-1]ETW74818.1 hypothetical protein HETIRDRAFT_164961 [Heterobasidion irregulare TC 32-1]